MSKTVVRISRRVAGILLLAIFPNLSFGQSARLWVANGLAETASRIILDSGTVSNHLLTLGIIPNQIVVSDNYLLAVNSGESNIQVFNRNTLAELGTIELGPNKNPWNLVMVDSAAGYVTNFNTNTVSKFNAISRTVLDEFPVGQSPEGLAFARGKIWVCNTGFNPNDFSYGQGELAVIDPAADSVVARINVGTNPQAVKPTPDGKLLAVCTGNFGSISGSLYIIDPTGQTVTDSILTGGQPSTAAVTSGNIAYLPAGGFVGNGNAFKVNLNTKTVERGPGNPIPVGTGATDAVYDIDSGWVYVACFSDGTVKKIGPSDAVVASFQMGDGSVSLDIAYPFRAGDLNGDGQASPADVVALLGCVFSGCAPAPRNSQMDLNRDGHKTPSDVVCELNHVFLGAPLPCR
ncbi:MAG TPA: YncE family protein [Verrucomicrobiae bacterium]|nr:YncE family protein [Verrucomicrobiae bacterium]